MFAEANPVLGHNSMVQYKKGFFLHVVPLSSDLRETWPLWVYSLRYEL